MFGVYERMRMCMYVVYACMYACMRAYAYLYIYAHALQVRLTMMVIVAFPIRSYVIM